MFGVTNPSKPRRKAGRRISGHPAGYPRGTVGTGGECWLGLRSPSPAPLAAGNGPRTPRGGCHGILKGWEALGPDIEKVALGEGSSLTKARKTRKAPTTNSAAVLLSRCTAWPENARWTCPSGWWLSSYSHCLSICPRAPRSTSARATACARKRAFGNLVAAWPKLAPDGHFGYI